MEITVLGCGRWGSFLAWYFSHIGLNVLLWGRETSSRISELRKTRKNEYVTLDEKIIISTNIIEAVTYSEIIVIAIEGHKVSEFLHTINKIELSKKKILLAMKGFDYSTHQRLSSIVSNYISKPERVAVFMGPGHPKEIVSGIPTKMIIDSMSNELKSEMARDFSSDLISINIGNDIIGNEVGAAAKNVLGIAAGILDANGYQSLKGCLMVEGLREISILIDALAGNPLTAYGTACLGDFQATLFSNQSNSVNYGRSLVTGEPFKRFAPGKFTSFSVKVLCERHQIVLPIFNTIYDVIYSKGSYEHLYMELLKGGENQ